MELSSSNLIIKFSLRSNFIEVISMKPHTIRNFEKFLRDSSRFKAQKHLVNLFIEHMRVKNLVL